MTELTSVTIVRRMCEENEFFHKDDNENESFDADFQEFDNAVNSNDWKQFFRTSSFSKTHKTSLLIQDKIKTFENSTAPVNTTPINSKFIKNTPAGESEESHVCIRVTNPFLKAVFLNEEEEDANVLESNNKTKVSNYTFLIFKGDKTC